MSKTTTISVRVSSDLKARLNRASADHPYKPSLTSIVERGLELALAELATQAASMTVAVGPP